MAPVTSTDDLANVLVCVDAVERKVWHTSGSFQVLCVRFDQLRSKDDAELCRLASSFIYQLHGGNIGSDMSCGIL